VDERGRRTTFAYDALNRVTATTDPLNRTSTVVYDKAGNVVQQIDPTTLVYDALNRQVSSQDPTGGIWTTVYDGDSNVIAQTDPANSTSSSTAPASPPAV
jgi:YD repeat-containing protein